MRTRITLAAALSVAALGLAARAQEPPPQPSRARIVAAATEVMRAARFCTLVTIDGDGQPRARVMEPFAPEAGMTVWMATNAATRKVSQIRGNPRVTLIYFDQAHNAWVTLAGNASLVTDAAEKAKRWKDSWSGFYKNKNAGEDYLLIRVKPSRLEVLDPARGMNPDPATWRPVALELR
jgi:general stress protein 26